MTTTPMDPTVEVSKVELDDGHIVLSGALPGELVLYDESFNQLWALRPLETQQVLMYGKWVTIPRRQKAYLRDYKFSGKEEIAETTLPEILQPFLAWAQTSIDERLNGLLLNFYDGALGEYIGPHHDDKRQLVVGSPIVTISQGQERVFRLTREAKVNGKKSVVARHDLISAPGNFIVLPWETNVAWKHSVPDFAHYQGRRVSITLRCFR